VNQTRTRCRRYNCAKHVLDGEEYCSALCLVVAHQVAEVEAICRTVAPGNVTGRLWAAVVTLADTVSEIGHLRTLLKNHIESPRQETPE